MNGGVKRARGRICFHLSEDALHGFSFAATYSRIDDEGYLTCLPIADAMKDQQDDTKSLLHILAGLETAGRISYFISHLTDSGEIMYPLSISSDEAYSFLRQVPLLKEAGLDCSVPDWWDGTVMKIFPCLVVGKDEPEQTGSETLLSVYPSMELNGKELTEEEREKVLGGDGGLIKIRGRWAYADPKKMKQALYRLKDRTGSVTMFQAIRLASGMKPGRTRVLEGAWFHALLGKMRNAEFSEEAVPETFRGQLRPYQQRGFSWLCNLRRMGFGACLADDMGLGKTVQTVVYLEKLRELNPDSRHLLVVPASLLGNWSREIARFAPEMPHGILHGESDPGDVFLTVTTYGMTVSREQLSEKEWDTVIVDEAQAIKNPGTKQSKSIRALKGYKLALTGTPVENSLKDMWTLFDLIDRGLLGTMSEFNRFVRAKRARSDTYERIKSVTSPFILRRLKTDRSIIDDLPDKTEMDIPSELTQKQKILYRACTEKLRCAIMGADRGKRRGLVLAALTGLKQICDHPDLYTGGEAFEEREAGKYAQLRQICETIRDSKEQVLVFTQYREMTGPLSQFLEQLFGKKGLVLHGGVSIKGRNDMVERFNDPKEYTPFMVLSLKAGGVGLNLTGANHVIHYDRWWNPAVEDQATDRAYRIGQMKNVMVYRLVSEGTVEDRIAEKIGRKRELAESVVSTGENWIDEMTDAELMDFFSLK